jgi:glutamate-1-semialdehyde aminotransferase
MAAERGIVTDHRYVESARLFERAAVIPGRSLTRSKAPGQLFDVGAGPLYANVGDGAILTDVDGNRYIDMVCALGAISLGYGASRSLISDPTAAAVRAVTGGWIYSLPHINEVRAAEAVLRNVAPWASHVRFVKTGSEATHAAYRIVCRATGRPIVLVASNAYHGWHEWCWFDDDARVSASHAAVRYPYGCDWELDLFECLPLGYTREHVAAIFVEPARWQDPNPNGWLQQTRELCDHIGALLVFDEMIYGGRWALGGATEYFGVMPDLACFGKAIGNGAPIACVVGREALADYGELVSGTYSGDAAALAACIEVIRTYAREPVIDTLWTRGRQLTRGLREAIAISKYQVALEGELVHQRLRFENPMRGRQFAAAMAKRGVLWHPDVVNICYAHTEAHIERVVEAALASMVEIGRAE